MNVRHVIEDNFSEITEILNHYILHSDARYFESVPVSLSDRKSWLYTFNQQTPYQMLVAVSNGEVLGFCCSQKYRPEPAYNKTVEVSVYISPKSTSAGVGTSLYDTLFKSLESFDLHRAVAGIALPNVASLAFHHKFGFTEVGTFDEYGVKDGRFISATWLQKKL
ncbi:N-acetyltransferase family protein [Franzmannia qiaohouensis]|uniref:GNAT family N-acetyltransferase n=1 Tax=Franzmannia qiaohouensis TaxID=1329370 RepID=A0ABU1HIU8_9GAMM|nr:N-acetyltransferase family protein [Halomonas qiaohouensis]MDR5907417.1 GNAT family N-acetyltransferase [Halomonas qiaohouensis]